MLESKYSQAVEWEEVCGLLFLTGLLFLLSEPRLLALAAAPVYAAADVPLCPSWTSPITPVPTKQMRIKEAHTIIQARCKTLTKLACLESSASSNRFVSVNTSTISFRRCVFALIRSICSSFSLLI